jgi:hypothetical protein
MLGVRCQLLRRSDRVAAPRPDTGDQPRGVDAVELSRNLGTDRLPMKKPKKEPAPGRTESTSKPSRTRMVRKSKPWGGIATSMTKSDFLFRPSASLPKSFHRSGRGKSSKSRVWHLKTPAPPKCSCSSAGTIELWQFPYHNWSPLNPTNPPQRPLATGITGWRRDTASEPRRPGRHYAALPKTHGGQASACLPTTHTVSSPTSSKLKGLSWEGWSNRE